MTRPNNPRRVGFLPEKTRFNPAGVKTTDLGEVVLGNDELEAVRLKDLLGLSQGEAAEQMRISQPTFHRLVLTAHRKIADALVNGKAVRIEGGNIDVGASFPQPCHWRKRQGCKAKTACEDVPQSPTKIKQADKTTRVAVTSMDGKLEGMVDERFGRSRKIIVYDKESLSFEVIDNTPNMNSPQAAGIQTAQNVVKASAQVVISGHLGPNAFGILKNAGIEAYSAENMTVQDALKKLEEGALVKLAGPNVEKNWGRRLDR